MYQFSAIFTYLMLVCVHLTAHFNIVEYNINILCVGGYVVHILLSFGLNAVIFFE